MIPGDRLRYEPYLSNDPTEEELADGQETNVRRQSFEADKNGMYVEPKYVSYGDYGGSMVERSNYEEFLEAFDEHRGTEWWTWYGDYGSHGIIVRVDADARVPEIGEFFTGLEDYPSANDERLSELEHEAINEGWDDYGFRDFLKALEPLLPGLEDYSEQDGTSDIARQVVSQLYWALSDLYGYPEVEDAAGSVAFHTGNIIRHLQEFVDDLNAAGINSSAEDRSEAEDGTYGPKVFEELMAGALYGSKADPRQFEYGGHIYKILSAHHRLYGPKRQVFRDLLEERGLEAGFQFLEKQK